MLKLTKKKAKKNMAMSNQICIIFDDERWKDSLCNCEVWANDVCAQTLQYLKDYNLGFDGWIDKEIIINLSLSNNQCVQALNSQFRGKDKPTNVLSFANIDDEYFAEMMAENYEIELGDIIVALETLQKEAKEKNILLESHFAHLLVHGILHLFGYDHQDDDEADEMENIEIEILKRLNIEDPYNEIDA